jgi:hypothetical protein
LDPSTTVTVGWRRAYTCYLGPCLTVGGEDFPSCWDEGPFHNSFNQIWVTLKKDGAKLWISSTKKIRVLNEIMKWLKNYVSLLKSLTQKGNIILKFEMKIMKFIAHLFGTETKFSSISCDARELFDMVFFFLCFCIIEFGGI